MKQMEEKFEPIIDFMVKEATKDLSTSLPKWQNLLKAYNTMRIGEYDSADYIYDTANNADVISLLEGLFSFDDIVRKSCHEIPFLMIVDEKGKSSLRGIGRAEMIEILKANLHEIMWCVIKDAPYCADYMDVYKDYICFNIEE